MEVTPINNRPKVEGVKDTLTVTIPDTVATDPFPVPAGDPVLTVNSSKILAQNNPTATGGWYGRSQAVVRDGIVIHLYREATSHPVNTYGRIHIIFSDDYGGTWSDEDEYLDGTAISGFPMTPVGAEMGQPRGPVEGYLILCPNGDLLCQMWSRENNNNNDGYHQARSTDGGLTWDTPAKITIQGYTGLADKAFAAEDRKVVDGKIYVCMRAQRNELGYQENFVMRSDDNGVSWNFHGQISTSTDPVNGTKEVGMEYVGDSTWTCMLRNFNNTDGRTSRSTDNGETWSSPADTPSLYPAGMGVGHSMIYTRGHLKLQPGWWNDPVLYAVGFIHTNSPNSTNNRRNCMWVSKDKGLTWSGPLWLDVAIGDGGYNDMFWNPLTNEIVVVAYFGSYPDGASLKQYNCQITFE